MAGIAWEGDRAKLTYRDAAGKQKALRLGKCTTRDAKSALTGFEHVLAAHRLGTNVHPDGIAWLERLDERLHARVAALGLVEPRKGAEVVTLGALLDHFDETVAVKPGTRTTYRQALEMLRAHFGESAPLASITPAAADGWRKAISEAKSNPGSGDEPGKVLAAATVAKRIRVAKSVFHKAVKWGMLPASPFADLRAGSQSNPERSHYVSRESIDAILAACPDDQWRAIVALSRYAGLRCPSEVVALRWGDVNWERGRLTVRSPKTAGHEGRAVRVVPLAPELRPILLALFDAAAPGTEAVIPRLRDGTVNLRTSFTKIITRAGEKPWPRLFHNLRASCATDWVERFPAHVVAGWLGHSPMIAARHYLQTRDAHFDLAAGVGGVAANPAAQVSPSDSTAKHVRGKNAENPAVLVEVGVICDAVENRPMTPTAYGDQDVGGGRIVTRPGQLQRHKCL